MLKDPVKRRIALSYGFDWLLVIIMTVVFFAIDKVTPFHRQFSINDKTIMFPYAEHERVPVWLLLIICLLIPIVIIAIISLSGIGYKRNWYDFHAGVLGLCLGLSMTIMLTDVIKVTAGRPRPDMLSRCKPPTDTQDPPLGLSTVDICTTDIHSHLMIDGFKSFPSGHSSFSFAGLGYLSFYIAGKLRLFDQMGHTYKGFCTIFPFLGAMLVAISRTEDYRHHWHDVFIGALLGIVCAYFSYRQYYPSLGQDECHAPFMTRLLYWKDGTNNRQEEEEGLTRSITNSTTASASNNDQSIIFGASGFTGALTAEYLVEVFDKSINWGLAGRSLAKLEKVRDRLADLDPSMKKLDLLIADSHQPETLDQVVSQTRVIISTVGPFAKYGTPLVESCIRQKTHYVDITGEYLWVKDIIDRFHEKARQEKIMIVPCCGFDSVPSDLGTFILANHIQDKHGLNLASVKASVMKLVGGISGGTIQSCLEMASQDISKLTDPYILATRRGVDKALITIFRKDYDFDGKWQAPFIMSAVNAKVVRRSWSIWADRGKPYGNLFTYQETQSFSFLPGLVYVCLFYTVLPLTFLLVRTPMIGEKIKNLLPGSGYGPRDETRKLGGYEFQFVGTAEIEPYDEPVRARAIIKGSRDPGYGDTCRMVVEAALSIIKSRNEIPGRDGGVLTPSTAFGQVLVDRLKADNKMVIEVEDM
ncbi:hypothetical protein G6F37_004313 [Rhizopus arrhizus]|nr:hypothetical protein G6F37_004313 [Rhizopus arrhizus]